VAEELTLPSKEDGARADSSAVDRYPFPFSAIVGQEQLKLALILNAIAPGIGGVLIRGEKGTAKSTAVRAVGALLGDGAAVVDLPIGATEDRVIGSIDLQKILSDGEKAFTPGLLARAHEGVLYVDEVNLLPDHLVDVLLDAAAMGRVVVERDGISHSHPARFVLVGTMNPEEGELRPQLLDRFGLAVDVAAPRDIEARTAVIERRMAYDADPETFAAQYRSADDDAADRIAAARVRVATVSLPPRILRQIAALCAELDVDGLRGDIVVARAARAHAAWRGADEVSDEDVEVAAELALPHRTRRNPFDEPGLPPEDLQQALDSARQQADSDDDPDPDPEPDGGLPEPDGESNQTPDSPQRPEQAPAPDGTVGQSSAASAVTRLRLDGVGNGDAGRRSAARTTRGAAVRALAQGGNGIHVVGTVLAAAEASIDRPADRIAVAPDDIRGADRRGKEGNLIVFALDLSGSMAARKRLDAVTEACVALLRDAYQRRDRVAVVAFRGTQAEVAVPPTRSVDVAVRRLAQLRTGGRTPLAEGLRSTHDVIALARRREPQRRAIVVLLTDGRATSGPDAVTRALSAANRLRRIGTGAIVVDCEQGVVRLGLARDLAAALGAGHLQLAELTAGSITSIVQSAA
jgi:magnesium chelatase subunit D